MSVEEIVNETRALPAERVEELVARLNQNLDGADENGIDEAWRKEVRRRLAEVDSGAVQLKDGEEVSKRIRRIAGG